MLAGCPGQPAFVFWAGLFDGALAALDRRYIFSRGQ
jgi:hypothetical protein